jgi:hypothetical protein
MSRKVLLSGGCIEVLGHAMVLISEQRAAHVVLIEEFGGPVTIVDCQHIPTF